MSNDPKQAPEKMVQDALDEMVAQALAYTEPPPPDEKPPEEKTPPEEARPEAVSPAPAQRHNVFIYLTALFACAFLILLLAFLMQQHSNEAQLSGLQESIDALQAANDDLTAENQDLADKNQRINERANQAKQQYEADLEGYSVQVNRFQTQIRLWYLEHFHDEGDDIMAAYLIHRYSAYIPGNIEEYLLQPQLDFYTQYRDELLEKGFLTPSQDTSIAEPVVSDPQNRIVVQNVANYLWDIFDNYYQNLPEAAAIEIADLSDPDYPKYAAAIYSGAFSDFTVSQYEAIRDRLLEEGYLKETEDGYLTSTQPASAD